MRPLLAGLALLAVLAADCDGDGTDDGCQHARESVVADPNDPHKQTTANRECR